MISITSQIAPVIVDKATGARPKDELSDVPPGKELDEVSVESASMESPANASRWHQPYEPEPVISQGWIIGLSIFLFSLASIWPPLILLFSYLASKLVPYSFRVNDDASKRRQLFTEFAEHNRDIMCLPDHIHLEESYWVNRRGMSLCTSIMVPRHKTVKAVVCFCHGYSENASFVKRIENQRLVENGLAVVSIEYEGHGRSDGPLGLINSWDRLIDDVSDYFREVAQKKFRGLPVFLMGESMGGAVVYCTYKRIPQFFRGVVFVCPMCKISDDMLPPQWVIDFICWLVGPQGTSSILGYLPIAPSSNTLRDKSHKVKAKSDLVKRSPTSFCRNPRLATARELIAATQAISSSLQDFDACFLVVHGRDDRVTDPALSQALYEESKSKDKTIRLYDGMWHALTCGETDENIDMVFQDIIGWILARC